MPKIMKARSWWLLAPILGLGLYFRLWPIHLFKWISDYDEGAYSLGGRFISEGKLPYRDFVLVHPPLYDLTLAGVYKVFGYNFFYGRYLSVVLFAACVVIAYLIVNKLRGRAAGLVAAALFAIFPGLSSLWYRVVQEPLGILLLLMAIWLAADFISTGARAKRLFFSGLCLGLALTVKLTFAPAVVGFAVAVAVLGVRRQQSKLKSALSGLLREEFWLLIAGAAAGVIAVTGFFLATALHDFIAQTVLSQISYRVGGTFQSISARVSAAFSGTTTDMMNSWSLLVPVAVLVLLLMKRHSSRSDRFMIVSLAVSIVLSALFKPFGENRYFAPAYVLALLAMATLTPALNWRSLTGTLRTRVEPSQIGTAALMLVLLACSMGSAILLRDYNFMGQGTLTYEEAAYGETKAFLDESRPKLIYAVNPIIPALCPEIPSTPEFDTFGELQPLMVPPDALVQQQVSRGVDYIVVDAFARLMGNFHNDMAQTIQGIEDKATLVKTVVPGQLPVMGVEIYAVRNP